MNSWKAVMPPYDAEMVGYVHVLEASPGANRLHHLQQWLQTGEKETGARTWILPCDFNEGGAWAGLQDLLQDIFFEVHEQAPELVTKHSYELCLAAPALRRFLEMKYPSLTDVAPENEQVRNYPLDRAYRSLHGLVDFLDAWWFQFGASKPWIIVCDDYDKGETLVQRFFSELIRRRGHALQLTLLVAVTPGQKIESLESFEPSSIGKTFQVSFPEETLPTISVEESIQSANQLESQIEHDPIVAAVAIPRLIRLWEQSGSLQKALYWKIQAMHRFNKLGLYDMSFVYCKDVDDNLVRIYQEQREHYQMAAISVFFCYLSLGDAQKSYEVMQEKVIRFITVQPGLSHCHYLLAILYSRFFQPADFDKAVEHLELGLRLLKEDELPAERYHFFVVFLLNGLAYVRLRQKRPTEAIELCKQGIETLARFLHPEQHKLHRSVLWYNIAQVYAGTGPVEEALNAYSVAIDMDPNYSEYFNERGSLYLKTRQLDEAVNDYLQAIELSPPYPEVWVNLGQCYREKEQWEEAEKAYSRALDMNPSVTLALVGRADTYEARGRLQEALSDYRQALLLDPQQPSVLASRAVLYYDLGQYQQALNDLNEAIQLAPEEAIFYQNRASAFLSLDCSVEAAQDLQMYLQLQPDAEDRQDVEAQLAQLV